MIETVGRCTVDFPNKTESNNLGLPTCSDFSQFLFIAVAEDLPFLFSLSICARLPPRAL